MSTNDVMVYSMKGPNADLLARLTQLLVDNEVGVGLLTPRPRGGRLSVEVRQDVEEVLDGLASNPLVQSLLVYGNGCFAVARYEDCAAVYQRILMDQPDHEEARFNLGLAYLRMKRLPDALNEFTSAIEQHPALGEAYYQRGNAHDDLGERDLALAGLQPSYRVEARLLAGLLQPGRCAGSSGPAR